MASNLLRSKTIKTAAKTKRTPKIKKTEVATKPKIKKLTLKQQRSIRLAVDAMLGEIVDRLGCGVDEAKALVIKAVTEYE